MNFKEHKEVLISKIKARYQVSDDNITQQILLILSEISNSNELEKKASLLGRICVDSLDDSIIVEETLSFLHNYTRN